MTPTPPPPPARPMFCAVGGVPTEDRNMTDQLHRLPNGAWIRLADVTHVIPRAADTIRSVGPRLTIIAGATHIELPFDSFDAACEYADTLAGLANGARK